MRTRNVNKGRLGFAVSPAKYQVVADAILASVPRTRTGVTFAQLVAAVGARVPATLFLKRGSVPWHTKVVQLDLEAQGRIERVPGSVPQRIRRASGSTRRSRT